MEQLNSKKLKSEVLNDAYLRMNELSEKYLWMELNDKDKSKKKELSTSFIQISLGEAVLLLGYVGVYLIDQDGTDSLIDTEKSCDELETELYDAFISGAMFAIER